MDSFLGHGNKTKNEEQQYEEPPTNYKEDQEQVHHKKQHQPASSSELLASAKIVAEAAKSGFGGGEASEKQKMDKAKVADAAADLLEAASQYGKLEDKSYGKYVRQAEDYLHKYGDSTDGDHHSSKSSHSSTTVGSDDYQKSKLEGSDYKSHGDDENKSGGYGDYMKMAQGFLGSSDEKKSSTTHGGGGGGGNGDDESKSGGYGDYVKMAQGFLKK